MDKALLDKSHVKPVLNSIRLHDGIRFSNLKRETGLLDTQLDRAIKILKENGLVWARSVPTKGTRVYAEYVLSPRGKQLAKALDAMVDALDHIRLDPELEANLRDWLQSTQEIVA